MIWIKEHGRACSNIFDGWGNFQWNSRSVFTTYKQITFLELDYSTYYILSQSEQSSEVHSNRA